MKKIVACLLALICLAGAMEYTRAEAAVLYQAVIANPHVADRLNVRSEPDPQAESLGRFYSGTPVAVLWETEGSDGDAWAFVQVGNAAWESAVVRGYVMKKYLMEANRNYGAPELFVTAEPVSGSTALRRQPRIGAEDTGSTLSGAVYVLGDIGDDWRYVMDEGWAAHGYVRTNQLKNKTVEIWEAYLMSADGGDRVTLYADKDLKNAVASFYSGAPVRVTDFNRAGWVRVESYGARYDSHQETPLVTGYAAQKDLLVFTQPWAVDWKTRTGYALQAIPSGRPGWAAIPRGAALEVMGEREDQYLVRYRLMGSAEDLCLLADKSAVMVSSLVSVQEGAAGIGYAWAPIQLDEEGYAMGYDAFVCPGGDTEGQEYEPLCRLLAKLPEDGFLQVRRMGEPSFFIRSEGVKIIEEKDLLPRDPAGKQEGAWTAEDKDAGLWVYTRENGGASSLTLTNESADLHETYAITEQDGSNTSFAVYIPAGTQVTLTGEGILTAFDGQGAEPVLLSREGSGSVAESVPLFSGTGRFFCDLQVQTCYNYYDFRLRPIQDAEECSYRIGNLFEGAGEARTAEEEEGYLYIHLSPGEFIELHNYELYLFYGNG